MKNEKVRIIEPEKYGTQWSLYDSHVQSHRSNSLSSQSLLLAIGALLRENENGLLFITFVIAMIQMWYIWFRVIRVRSIISDYYKFNYKYQFSSFINDNGDETNAIDEEEKEDSSKKPLTEKTYYNNVKIRQKANKILAEKVLEGHKHPEFKKKFRLTRLKLDVLLPISFSILWIALVCSRLFFHSV